MSAARDPSRTTIAIALSTGLAAMLVAPSSGQVTRRASADEELTQWVRYLASDDLQGRAMYSSGLGLAAGYIVERLRAWGLEPAGDSGSFLQTVRVSQVTSVNRSTVTVRVGDRSRTFAHGEGAFFQPNVGGARRLSIDRVEFAGYGIDAPAAHHEDLTGRDLRGAAVIWLGRTGPKALTAPEYRRVLAGRHRTIIDRAGAAASLGPPPTRLPQPGEARTAAASGTEYTTVEPLDAPVAPTIYGTDELFEFMFSQAQVPYAELARRALAQEPLPRFALPDVHITFDLNAEYRVVRTELAHNVAAVVRGRDPVLKGEYVGLGAHYDHLGYAADEPASSAGEPARAPAPGLVKDPRDRIWNGADDNASGTAALMALARAFAAAPPRRSLLLVWHTGEERGLLGSRYFVSHPTVPLERLVAFLNLDMIGRNRDDKESERNTLYVIGAGRISTDLDALVRAANGRLERPLTLSYEFDDPRHAEQLYYRSDHASYAAKGIPIAFFTTGPHPDYHANTDDAAKIEMDKLGRVTGLVLATTKALAERDQRPVRDATDTTATPRR